MKRKGWMFGLVLVVLLVSPLVAPLAGAAARDELRLESVIADQGDDENGDEDDDDDDDGDPAKIALYWMGRNIYYASDPDAAAQEVLDRGFTHVVNRSYNLHEKREEWFSAKGFKVIQDITTTRDDLAITPRFSSPYAEPAAYAARLANLEAHLLSQADYLVGIDDDIELYPWPTRIYDEQGQELLYPRKELIANDPDDYDYRIGNATAGSSWTTFKDYPSAGYHDLDNLTIENIEYNYPQLSTSHEAYNSRLNLGYFAPAPAVQVGKIAQTFRPEHDRITRIDILLARHGSGAAGFPLGHVYFYLTETTEDGKPNESERLFAADLRIKWTETDYVTGDDFTGIVPLSLYFDPEEHGVLDTTKTYALVLQYRGSGAWGEDSVWYVLAADNTDGYGEGASFRHLGGDRWGPFEGTDIWFKVYYPDPPAGWGLRELHEDWIDFQTTVMQWHLEQYRQILDRVNATKGTSLDLYVWAPYSEVIKDYLDRTIGNLHGDIHTRSYFSADWDKLASAGLDYAVSGYGQKDMSATLAELAGRATLIGGAQNQEDFEYCWWQCHKNAMLFYLGSTYEEDPGVVVPQGRSPKSAP